MCEAGTILPASRQDFIGPKLHDEAVKSFRMGPDNFFFLRRAMLLRQNFSAILRATQNCVHINSFIFVRGRIWVICNSEFEFIGRVCSWFVV